jgi:hypothetical protein
MLDCGFLADIHHISLKLKAQWLEETTPHDERSETSAAILWTNRHEIRQFVVKGEGRNLPLSRQTTP